jgi:hypothetical protein
MLGTHWATIVCFKKSLFILMMGDNIKMQGDDEDFWSHEGNAKGTLTRHLGMSRNISKILKGMK